MGRLIAAALAAASMAATNSMPQNQRIGQLEFEAVALDVGAIASADVGPWELKPGEQFVVVRLKLRNTIEHWNCTTVTIGVRTNQGTEHQADQAVIESEPGDSFFPTPLKGLTGGGSYSYFRRMRVVARIPDAAQPIAIIIHRIRLAGHSRRVPI